MCTQSQHLCLTALGQKDANTWIQFCPGRQVQLLCSLYAVIQVVKLHCNTWSGNKALIIIPGAWANVRCFVTQWDQTHPSFELLSVCLSWRYGSTVGGERERMDGPDSLMFSGNGDWGGAICNLLFFLIPKLELGILGLITTCCPRRQSRCLQTSLH